MHGFLSALPVPLLLKDVEMALQCVAGMFVGTSHHSKQRGYKAMDTFS